MCCLPKDRIAKREGNCVCLSEFWLAIPLEDNPCFLLCFLTPKTWGSIEALQSSWLNDSHKARWISPSRNAGQYIIDVVYSLVEGNFFSCLYNTMKSLYWAKIHLHQEYDVERALVRAGVPASSRKHCWVSLQCVASLADAGKLAQQAVS